MYERTLSECKSFGFIHNVVGRNMTVLSQTEYDNNRKEYEIIVKELVIPKDPTSIHDEVLHFSK